MIRDESAYAYLLGLYLGDGCLWVAPRTVQLQISLDARYPGIVERCRVAMTRVGSQRRVSARRRRGRECVVVSSYWTGWSELFPQHGPGPKHMRPIELAPWQDAIVNRHGWHFLRGLLESDGCRSINRVRVTLRSGRAVEYRYPRWFFVNASEDILALFCASCDRLDIHWTRSRARMVSISSRDSVALIDAQVGPKR